MKHANIQVKRIRGPENKQCKEPRARVSVPCSSGSSGPASVAGAGQREKGRDERGRGDGSV